jgi:hypothetical protein
MKNVWTSLRHGGGMLVGFILLSLFLCFMPSAWVQSGEYHLLALLRPEPVSMSGAGGFVMSVRERLWRFLQDMNNQELKQWVAHFVLMGAVALSLSFKGGAHGVGLWRHYGFVAWFVLLLSVAIELGQELLPAHFSRGFSWSDIVASISGGLVGLLTGGLLHLGHHLLFSRKRGAEKGSFYAD